MTAKINWKRYRTKLRHGVTPCLLYVRFDVVLAADGEDIGAPDGDAEVGSRSQHGRHAEPRARAGSVRRLLEHSYGIGRRAQLVGTVAAVHRAACNNDD